MITTKPFQDIVTDVQVNTFVSTMISLPGDYTNTTSTFSQSIAYAIGNDNRVGHEVGYFGYSYNDGGTVLIPQIKYHRHFR
ncbi:MAG: hypothetical protein IPM69_01720 [Ignavibacteria bacterium]|nr:hypothetical protein [Ignavibacteria bacterium]